MIVRYVLLALGLLAATTAGALVAASLSPKPVTAYHHALVTIPLWGGALLAIAAVLIAAIRYDRRQ